MSIRTFEDRLLDDLKREVRLRAAAEDSVPAARRRLTPVRVGVVLTACAAATVAALVLPESGGGAPGAYAVESRSDGTVRLSVELTLDREQQEDMAGRLRAAGVRVSVEEVPEGKECRMPRGELIGGFVAGVVDGKHRSGSGNKGESHRPGVQWEWVLKQGDTVVLEHREGNLPVTTKSTALYGIRGEVQPCVPVTPGALGSDGASSM